MRLSPKAQKAIAPELVDAAVKWLRDDPEVAGEIFANDGPAGIRRYLIAKAGEMLSEMAPISSAAVAPAVSTKLDKTLRFAEAAAYKYGYIDEDED